MVTTAEAPPGAPPVRSSPPWWAAVGALAAALLLGIAGWWWTHPSVLKDHGDAFTAHPRPLDRSALSLAVALPPKHGTTEMTLTSARALLDHDRARTRTSFSICRMVDPDTAVGYVHDLRERSLCSEVRALHRGSVMTYGPGEEYLVLTMTPTRPGSVHVHGVEVGYRLGADHLWQHGTQTVLVDASTAAR